MLQTRVYGRDRIQFMEEICTADVAGLPEGSASLTVFTNDKYELHKSQTARIFKFSIDGKT